MTLVIAVTGKNGIWMLTDRRLSFHTDRKPKEDARKLLFLDTTDGLAILGYAGLGSTALGIEPSDWMARVLRGYNLPLEQSLSVLADAVRAKLPQHLDKLRLSGTPAHYIIIPAFLNGEPRLYSISLVRPHGQSHYSFWLKKHVTTRQLPNGQTQIRPPTITMGGSGAIHLQRKKGCVLSSIIWPKRP